ncbi:Hypothetical protein A7982_06723 [Minicystis rosea]|nr:Hypothetical protein A7982_06723 [Minicystis rosea]
MTRRAHAKDAAARRRARAAAKNGAVAVPRKTPGFHTQW